MNLLIFLAWSDERPAWMAIFCRTEPFGRLLDLSRLQRLQRHLAPDELFLENLMEGAETVLGRRAQHHFGGGSGRFRIRSL